MDWFYQKTISNQVSFNGVGLHSGKPVRMTVSPGAVNTGVIFVVNGQKIPAHSNYLESTKFCTSLVHAEQRVRTVEHFLSAVVALGLDNLEVTLTESELPCMDGSAGDFYLGLCSVGLKTQEEKKYFAFVTKPVEVSVGESFASIKPHKSPKVSVSLEYSEPVVLPGGMMMSFDLFENDYAGDIARARTYGFEKDFDFFKKNRLALGATLDNCLVMNDTQALSPGGMRFKNEIVRHKILDVFGDLALMGGLFLGHYHGYKPGHSLNLLLVKELIDSKALDFAPLKIDTKYTLAQGS